MDECLPLGSLDAPTLRRLLEKERARRADPGKIARILKRVGKGKPPVEGDELPMGFKAKKRGKGVS